MAAADILPQIEALVRDKLQVVSYKWLSRNFSVPSNYAMRLLQEFVEKHANELEVIYVLSGWMKKNPETYCVKLSSRTRLQELQDDFEANCSVNVYSVQACIPNDLSLLWSSEFVQAEELFNQPLAADNCLRDNRFCGVSNSFVKRNVGNKAVGPTFVMSKCDLGVTKSSSPPQAQQQFAGPTIAGHDNCSSVAISGGRNDKISREIDQIVKHQNDNESRSSTDVKKKKDRPDKSSGNGVSLANLWGRASAISKPSIPAVDTNPDIQNDPQPQGCALEEPDAVSSEDDTFVVNNRTSYGGSSRKRKVIMDFSDDDDDGRDDDDNTVSLASPCPPGLFVQNSANRAERKNNSSLKKQEGDAFKAKIEAVREQNPERLHKIDSGSESMHIDTNLERPQKIDTGSESMHIDTGLFPEKLDNHSSEKATDGKRQEKCFNSSSNSSSRRKVLKKRIDERGREVTEVVWEEEAANKDVDKIMTTGETGIRPPATDKAPASGGGAVKSGNTKSVKEGRKDAKQGNILSFFKKI